MRLKLIVVGQFFVGNISSDGGVSEAVHSCPVRFR